MKIFYFYLTLFATTHALHEPEGEGLHTVSGESVDFPWATSASIQCDSGAKCCVDSYESDVTGVRAKRLDGNSSCSGFTMTEGSVDGCASKLCTISCEHGCYTTFQAEDGDVDDSDEDGADLFTSDTKALLFKASKKCEAAAAASLRAAKLATEMEDYDPNALQDTKNAAEKASDEAMSAIREAMHSVSATCEWYGVSCEGTTRETTYDALPLAKHLLADNLSDPFKSKKGSIRGVTVKPKGVTVKPKDAKVKPEIENFGVIGRSVGTATKTATRATNEALSAANAATNIAVAQTNAALSLMDASSALEYAATTTTQAVDVALEATADALSVAGEAVEDAMAVTMSVLGG